MNDQEMAHDHYLFLQKSFDEFNQATERLQNSFASLELRFQEINRELELRNEELKRTIAEKEEVKNYLRNILESLTTGVAVTDGAGWITTLNKWAETFFNVSQNQVTGKHISVLFGDLTDLDRNALSYADHFTDTGKKVNLKDRIVEIFASPMKTEQGETIGEVFILRDVTRVEKLEEMAMGEMAANIAHEIRNPLGSIELFASLLMKDMKDKAHQERLSHIITSVKNMDNKISNLLLFTTPTHPMMRKVYLHRIVKEVLRFSDPIIKQEDISLSVKYSSIEPCVSGDAEMLKQAVSPLCSEDSMRSVEVRISDTGIGITRDNLKKIFDPFFSTRERGSGLGLAIVHNIVHAHSGSIDVESRERGGTVFSITLPLFQQTRKSEVIKYQNILGDRHA